MNSSSPRPLAQASSNSGNQLNVDLSTALTATLSGLVRSISGQLLSAGIDTPEHDARMLVSEAFSMSLADLRMAEILNKTVVDMMPVSAPELSSTAAAAPITPQKLLNDLSSQVVRRMQREPLQLIQGHTWFRYIDVQVGPGVFIPRPETESLVQSGIDWIQQQHIVKPRIVDLCAGSGVIGLSLCKELPKAQVWAVERSPAASVWTAKNRDALIDNAGISPTQYQLALADATDSATLDELDGSIDMVISNPPYIPEDNAPTQPEVVDWDPAMALYGGSADGLRIPAAIIRRASSFLHQGGVLLMEHDITQAKALCDQARQHGFTHARTADDLTGRPRFLVATL
ncbi:MAG: peptide chain release factor N(5)-glutamine methyltransferase [Bifidobacterium sp.]|nr:peptide chain release factor N(5)-glutamine methyltransferase [Bifidobacterium sp.]MCI1635410.1 peptide chain release factor N(5)-glutamine methyltransferase [Bifidobacterium sp.]